MSTWKLKGIRFYIPKIYH